MSGGREIVPGSQVTLHFSLTLPDGTVAISTFGEEPLQFEVGDKTFQPAMEMALYGLQAGDDERVTLTPAQAYGDPDPALVHTLALSEFPADLSPEPGQIISFVLPGDEQTMGVVRELDGEQVRVDFNHPLAGQPLVFRVQILDVAVPGR